MPLHSDPGFWHEPETIGNSAYFVTRFLVNGEPDDVFASGLRSYVEYDFGEQFGLEVGHALVEEGRLLVAGHVSNAGTSRDGLVFALGGDVIFGGSGASFEE